MSTIKATTLSNLAGSKTVPTDTVVDGSAKAWVNFNGTGTVAIRRAFNVSSITDNGTGNYTVNFATAMPDANYARSVALSCDGYNTSSLTDNGGYTYTVSAMQIAVTGITGSTNVTLDVSRASVAIFS